MPPLLNQDFVFCLFTLRFHQFLFEIELRAVIGIKLSYQALYALHCRLSGDFGFWTVSESEECGCELEIGLEVVLAFDEQIEVRFTRRSNLGV